VTAGLFISHNCVFLLETERRIFIVYFPHPFLELFLGHGAFVVLVFFAFVCFIVFLVAEFCCQFAFEDWMRVYCKLILVELKESETQRRNDSATYQDTPITLYFTEPFISFPKYTTKPPNFSVIGK
jgi:hypothetical protein